MYGITKELERRLLKKARRAEKVILCPSIRCGIDIKLAKDAYIIAHDVDSPVSSHSERSPDGLLAGLGPDGDRNYLLQNALRKHRDWFLRKKAALLCFVSSDRSLDEGMIVNLQCMIEYSQLDVVRKKART